MEKTSDKQQRVVKVFIWTLPLILLFWIVYQHIVPFGKLTIRYTIPEESDRVLNFASKEPDRVIGTSNTQKATDYFQLITVSPLYFDVKVPRPFQKATVTLRYDNPDKQEILRLGVKQPGENNNYYYEELARHPIALENLPDYWEKIQENNVYLWQRNAVLVENQKKQKAEYEQNKGKVLAQYNKSLNELVAMNEKGEVSADEYEKRKLILERDRDNQLDTLQSTLVTIERPPVRYASIQEFFQSLPPQNKLLQYNYELSDYYQLPGYRKSTVPLVITKSIRGSHQIYTYIGKDESLSYTFQIQDINRHQGKDVFSVTLYNHENEKIKSYQVDDDGVDGATGKPSQEMTLTIVQDDLPFGLYRLTIETPDDIFIKQITTFQQLLMFSGKIYLTDSLEYKDILGEKAVTPTAVYTTSTSLEISTSHIAGLQDVLVGSNIVKVETINTPFTVKNLKSITAITSPENDVVIQGNGFFAFSQNQLFNPNDIGIPSVATVAHIDDYDYIISKYKPASISNGDFVAQASVSVPYLFTNNHTVSFIIALPEMSEQNKTLHVKEVSILFEKKPITFQNAFPRLMNLIKRVLQ